MHVLYINGRIFQVVLLFLTMCSSSLQANDQHPIVPPVNTDAPDFSLQDINGVDHKLSQYKGKYVVLEWVQFRCKEVDKRYRSGQMTTLQDQLTSEGAVWLSITSGATGKDGLVSVKQLRRQVEKREGRQTAFLVDTNGSVGLLYGVTVVPHMVLVSPDGDVLYEGALENLPDPENANADSLVNYVTRAMDQHKKGEPVSVRTAEPYGCEVKFNR